LPHHLVCVEKFTLPYLTCRFYQLCNEFGQQTCEPYATDCATGEAGLPPSVFAPFSHDDDLQRGLRLCEQLFGIRATPPALWTGKQRGWTNVAHGGRGAQAAHAHAGHTEW